MLLSGLLWLIIMIITLRCTIIRTALSQRRARRWEAREVSARTWSQRRARTSLVVATTAPTNGIPLTTRCWTGRANLTGGSSRILYFHVVLTMSLVFPQSFSRVSCLSTKFPPCLLSFHKVFTMSLVFPQSFNHVSCLSRRFSQFLLSLHKAFTMFLAFPQSFCHVPPFQKVFTMSLVTLSRQVASDFCWLPWSSSSMHFYRLLNRIVRWVCSLLRPWCYLASVLVVCPSFLYRRAIPT